MKKLLPLIIVSSNLLYSNILLINLNFGTEDNIRTYKDNYPPAKYSDINLKETKSLFNKSTFDFITNLPSGDIETINVGYSYYYTNWTEFTSWGEQSLPSDLNSDNIIILSKKISEINPYNSLYVKKNSDYDNIVNYNFCEKTRYESNNLLINILKSETDEELNNNISTFTPELTIKSKKMNNEEGAEFINDYLNIKNLIEILHGDLTNNQINNIFSKVITSVDINKWEYKDNISKDLNGVENFNLKIDNTILNLNKIKENTSKTKYIIDVLKIIKSLNSNYQSTLSSNTELFKGEKVCLNFTENSDSVLTQLNNITISNSEDLLRYMKEYNSEKIVFNYQKELLKFEPNIYKVENFTLTGTYGDKTMDFVYEWIDKENVNFSREGAFVSKILTTEGTVVNISKNTYHIPSVFQQEINLNNANAELETTGEALSDTQTKSLEEQESTNESNTEVFNEVAEASVEPRLLSREIINLKFNKSYGTDLTLESDQPTIEEWEWIERLNIYIIDTENNRREERRNQLEIEINNNITEINNLEDEKTILENLIENSSNASDIENYQNQISEISTEQQDYLSDNESKEEEILLNQELLESEEFSFIEDTIYTVYSDFN